MVKAAGILFACNGRVLLMHRTDGGGWAAPGGGIEDGESAEEAARREISEEVGLDYTGPLTLWTRRVANDVDFTTFLAKIDEEFEPTLNDEHDAWNWVDRNLALTSTALHPGAYVTLRRFDMDELGVAKSIRDGELTSPQYYGKDLMLVALRITGTGGAYRPAHDEYAWRDASLYLNQEFLERCNGLPVIFRHPAKSLLNTDEFRDRIVGSIFVPYIREEEVWGIAKILDMKAAHLLENYEMSTSPAVLCLGDQIDAGDGKPQLLDHLALLIPDDDGDSGQGVWDRGGPLRGVESIDALPTVTEEPSPLDVIANAIMSQKIDKISNRL